MLNLEFDKSKFTGKFGYCTGKAPDLADPSLHVKAQDYKRRVGNTMKAVSVEDAFKLPQHEGVPFPAGLVSKNQPVEEAAPAGLVDDAAVHEIPALPGDDEVAAIAAEQEAGAEAEAQADAAAEADADAAAQTADNQKADAAESDKSAPAADEGKEG